MDHSRIIRGAVGGGRYTVTAPITQWDYGYIFQPIIEDLPATYRLDFSNDEHSGTAYPVYCGANGGEVATLDFTPSQTGICDVVFTSGSTPTVVTLPSTVKFPDGVFVAEADTTYEINILDGIYGAVMAWT